MVQHELGALAPLLAHEIGTPEPQLEPQITSLDKCKMNYILSETPVYSISGVGVGGSYSIGGLLSNTVPPPSTIITPPIE